MEKKRGTTIAVVAALIIAVVSLGIAFAAFSQTLTINGTATVTASKWDVHFENLSNPTISTGATVTTAPTLTDTSFSGLVVNFNTPGQSISYTWHVVNEGNFNATLSTSPSTLPSPVCKVGDDATATSAVNVCKHLTWTVTGAQSSLAANTGDDTITFTLTYNDHNIPAELPTENVTVTLPTYSLVYTQSGGYVAPAQP